MIVSGQQKRVIGLLQEAFRRQKIYLRIVAMEPSVMSGIKLSVPLIQNKDALLDLAGQLRVETGFAEWDIAVGKIDGDDLQHI